MYAIGNGRKVVTTAGTAVPLESKSYGVEYVIITAETDNGDYIAVGGVGVIEADATRTGLPLAAGDSATLYFVDMNQVYIDAAVNGEGVTYVYFR